ncbi:hypothetical protein BN2476_160060 [Paraburkholderia piptadeniae]|uniref:Uncharacterized protein n=1 Tax=Paraburkholderia piptadeniae TaxID=1701573 RepID=A0A1N7RSQ4_9BURK|nr:hypothetical protein BN2476_160060 [Paraburkholderia piptadeniae]
MVRDQPSVQRPAGALTATPAERVAKSRPYATHASLHTNHGLGLIDNETIHRVIHCFGAQLFMHMASVDNFGRRLRASRRRRADKSFMLRHRTYLKRPRERDISPFR